MSRRLDLDAQNKVTVMLVQALWGSITPNFRLVALGLAEPVWQLLFILEAESSVDRDEIDEVVGEFDALALGFTESAQGFQATTIISKETLPGLDPASWRVVFRRREM
jgi:hypothetical protein